MKTTICIAIIFCIISSIIVPIQSLADVKELRTLERNYEPMYFRADTFLVGPDENPKFRNAAFEHLFAFAYHAATDEWVQIPFQIDECGGSDDYIFDSSGHDYHLFEHDEISFMAKDLGDRVSENEWIDDADSRNYPRFEILVENIVSGAKGWFYLYRSSTCQDTVSIDYVSRTNNDIYTDIYTVGHNDRIVMDHLSFPAQRGTRGTRIIDRQKVRLVGTANYSGFTLDYNKNENDLNKEEVNYMDGRIRIIQAIKWTITIDVGGMFTIDLNANLMKRFYQYSMEVVGGQGELPADAGCQLVRQSIDIHQNFTGSRFYNPYNAGLVLNRWADQVVNKTIDIPGVTWILVTKDQGSVQGSFMQLIYLSNAIGEHQRLYYCERDRGTDDNDAYGTYGTSDTGEDGSWGDIGLHLSRNVQGQLNMASNLFFFRNPVDSAFGAQIADDFGNPMNCDKNMQYLDIVPPAPIVLTIVNSSDNSITWQWLAPGDDGEQGGPAELYEMRVTTYPPPEGDVGGWWDHANTVSNLPEPGEPGTSQSVEVSPLHRETNYYFLIRSRDDAGNYSDFSLVYTNTTTPVELIAFNASVEPDHVILNWQTASESNNFGFEIQRKTDEDEFEEIGFVKGAGTTDQFQYYSFSDNAVQPGEYDYRLKQIDTDGQFVFSHSVQATVEGPRAFALHQNYPNPFNGETTFKYEIPTIKQDSQVENTFDVSINIYNLLGQHVQTLVNERKTSGIYNVKWNSRNKYGQTVSSGVYLYHFTARSINGNRQVWSGVKKLLYLP